VKNKRADIIGSRLVSKFGTRDPFVIARGLGIHVYFEDFQRLKGMYRVIERRRCIFLNNNLPESMARIVCAHEIGHDQLHRDYAKGNGLQEFMIYQMTSRQEYEANIVAASILLPDDEIIDYIYNYNYDAEQIARVMNSDINLVALKIAHLQSKGHKLHGLEHDSKFLK
jgi:Zn-dependent peptidase ImmA (M78 family)